jgi:hypothetical protein
MGYTTILPAAGEGSSQSLTDNNAARTGQIGCIFFAEAVLERLSHSSVRVTADICSHALLGRDQEAVFRPKSGARFFLSFRTDSCGRAARLKARMASAALTGTKSNREIWLCSFGTITWSVPERLFSSRTTQNSQLI